MFKTRMRELRARLGMDQATLAQKVGCRRETIGNIENGRYNPSLKLGMKIAHELGEPVEDIFFFSDDTED